MDLRKRVETNLMAEPIPKFGSPPVAETVLSLQFQPLVGYTTTHGGWFWREYLSKVGEWPRVVEAPPLPDQVEAFGQDAGWVTPGVQFFAGQIAARTQIIRSDEERMIQIQNSRFILNWKRGAGEYPSYEALLPEFKTALSQFMKFSNDAEIGEVIPTQWEMTYVNHITRGELWSTFEDIPEIFDGLTVPIATTPMSDPDTFNANWRYVIGDDLGRLYVAISHARLQPDDTETLRLQIIARGPVTSAEWNDLKEKFDLGHDCIVRTFAEITTPAAHKFWNRLK